MSFSEKIQHLNQEISATVESTLSDLRQEVQQVVARLRASNDEILQRLESFKPALPASFVSHDDLANAAQELQSAARSESRDGSFHELRDAFSAIDKARSQAEILSALLAETGRFASRGALLLVRGGELRGWGGHGFGDSEQAIRDVTLDLPADGAWGRAIQGEGALHLSTADCATFCSRIESPMPSAGLLVPLVLRDRVAAALYVDAVDGAPIAAEALQTLVFVAALAIESLAFRDRAATSTLSLVGEPAAQPAPQPAAPPAAAAHETAPTHSEPEPAHEPEPESHPPVAAYQEAPPTPTVQSPAPAASSLSGDRTPATPTQQVDLNQLTPYLSETPAHEPAPPSDSAIDSTRNETVLLQRPAFRDAVPAPWGKTPTAPADDDEATEVAGPSPSSASSLSSITGSTPISPLAAVPPPPPAADDRSSASFEPLRSGTGPIPAIPSGSTPEVRPPSGVQGPGWAFATTRLPVSPRDEALHEEARRLAIDIAIAEGI